MKDKSLRKYYKWFVLVIVLIIIFIIYTDNKTFWDNRANLTTIIGVGISFIALTITIIEIYAISDIALLTKIIVDETKNKIKNREDIANISEIIQTINNALENITNNNFVVARIQLNEVKKSLINIYDTEKLDGDTIERKHYDYVEQAINTIGHLNGKSILSNQKKEAIHIQLNQVSTKLLLLNKKNKNILL